MNNNDGYYDIPLEDVNAMFDAIESVSDNDSETENDYEELLELGDRIGCVNIGLNIEQIENLQLRFYINNENIINEYLKKFFINKSEIVNSICNICKSEYEYGDKIITLSCNHHFHSLCIKKWLNDNKTCVTCRTEIN